MRIEVSDADPTRSIDLECGIYFNAPRDSLRDNVSIYVKSFDSKLALQTFAALDEQVQRAFLDDWIYLVLKGRAPEYLFVAFPVLLGIPLAFLSSNRVSGEELPSEQLKLLLSAASRARTSDEKINFLFEITRQEIEKKTVGSSSFNPSSLLNIKTLFVILPIAIVLGCIFYTVSKCYPSGIFLWGDYEAYYNRLTARRNTLWTVVVLSIVLGIVTNFFVMGLAGFINIS